jgi:hypothetical protein
MRRAAGRSLCGLPSVISYVPLIDGELARTTFRPLRLHINGWMRLSTMDTAFACSAMVIVFACLPVAVMTGPSDTPGWLKPR